MKKILCIAQSCCDMIFGGLPQLPGPGQEIYGDSFTVRPGGGANTPCNLACLGADVTFLTGIGVDAPGKLILAELERSGVRLAGAIGLDGSTTAVSAVLSTAQDRSFASYGGSDGAFFTQQQLEAEIQKVDIVHTYLGYSIAFGIGNLCRRYGKELSLDVSWCDAQNTPEVWQELGCCAWLKLNEGEAMGITGAENAEIALQMLAGKVQKGAVVTLGSRGSIGMEAPAGKLLRQEIIPRGEFRDACGAGDAYAAGLLFGISAGQTLENAMVMGAELSGLCVTWLGGNIQELNCTMLSKRFCTKCRK